MARDIGRRDSRELGDVRPHLLRAEGAVDADDQRLGMLDRGPESLDRLARERPTATVDDRDGDPERDLDALLLQDVARGHDRCLRVQRVEDCLDEEEVDAAIDEGADLLRVGLTHLVEGDAPEGRVIDLRGERECLVQRPDRAGDEPRPAVSLVGGLSREPGALDVHVVDRILEPVVGLADRRRRERVGRRDVGAGCEVLPVHVEDDVRSGQVQDVRIALDVPRVVAESLAAVVGVVEPLPLEHRAPGAVEHEDALG